MLRPSQRMNLCQSCPLEKGEYGTPLKGDHADFLIADCCRSILCSGSTVSSVNGAAFRSVDSVGCSAGSGTAPDTAGMARLRALRGQRSHGRAAALLLLASTGPDPRTVARGLLDMQAPAGQCRDVVDMRALQFELSDRLAGSVTRVCLGPSEFAPSHSSSHLRAYQCHLCSTRDFSPMSELGQAAEGTAQPGAPQGCTAPQCSLHSTATSRALSPGHLFSGEPYGTQSLYN